MALNENNAVICECKYTEEPFDEKQLKDLQDSALCIHQQNKTFIIFAKNGISSGVKNKIAGNQSYSVVNLKDLYN